MVLKKLDMGICLNFFQQELFNFTARQILAMKYPARGMTAFPAKIKRNFPPLFGFCKRYTPLDKLFDSFRSLPDNHLNNILMAETVTCYQRIPYVQVKGIFRIYYRRNAALRIVSSGLNRILFSNDRNPSIGAYLKGKAKPCNA